MSTPDAAGWQVVGWIPAMPDLEFDFARSQQCFCLRIQKKCFTWLPLAPLVPVHTLILLVLARVSELVLVLVLVLLIHVPGLVLVLVLVLAPDWIRFAVGMRSPSTVFSLSGFTNCDTCSL